MSQYLFASKHFQMSTDAPQLILASASPRRRELLAEAGYEFSVLLPHPAAESGMISGETPTELVVRLARQKAADVSGHCQHGLVLGCDTVVECEGQILGKPDDLRHAREMLELLRGHEHHVYSGLCLWHVPSGRQWTRFAVTKLVMAPISDEQVDEYLASGDWKGKAGAFGYQDGHDWLRILSGSESNVVGLPLELLAEMLQEVRQCGYA
jgi:septum formation protein